MGTTYTGRQRYVNKLYTFQCCLPNELVDIINKENIGKSCYKDKMNLMKAFVYLDILKKQVEYFKTGRTVLTPGEIEDPNYYLINGCLTKNQIEILLRQLKYYCNECCVDIQLD